MALHDDLIAAGLPVNGTAVEGATVLWTRTLTAQEDALADSIINPKKYQYEQSAVFAANIPNWATWTQAEGQAWYDSNLGNGNVDAITNLADAKVFMKKQNAAILRLMQMVIALRDYTGIIE